jgi:hypothetical protein
MKYLAVLIFFISNLVLADSASKVIAIEQFWKRFESTNNFSFTVVDNYRKSLPEGDPVRVLLTKEKNFKDTQGFVKTEFVTFVDTNFQTKEIRYLASIYKNETFRKFGNLLPNFTYGEKLNPKIKDHIETNLIQKSE